MCPDIDQNIYILINVSAYELMRPYIGPDIKHLTLIVYDIVELYLLLRPLLPF